MRQLAVCWQGSVLGVSTVSLLQPGDGAIAKRATLVFKPGSVAAAAPAITVEYPEVQVEVRAQIVHLGETIQVSVFNGLKRPIFTDTNRADCSIVMLERWTGREWAELPTCAATKLLLIVSVRPGQRVEISLRPGSKNLQRPGAKATIRRTGLYRLHFSYRFRAFCDSETGEFTESYSQSFRIVP